MSELSQSQKDLTASQSDNPGPSPVPGPTSSVTSATILAVNTDGTLSVDLTGDGTADGNIYAFAIFTPVVGMDVRVLTDAGGIQYVIGPVRSGTVLSPLEIAYPVGKRWISDGSTNPADILGFGTWVAAAEGRLMIGVGTSDVTYSAGTTGGQSNFGIDASHLPTSSPWTIHDPNHFHSITGGGFTYYTTGGSTTFGGSPFSIQTATGPTVTATTSTGVSLNSNAGGGNQIPTVGPWEAVYVFKRTA